MRVCTECGKIMTDGFCIGGGDEYYCSRKCLGKHYSEKEYDKLYQEEQAYWTEWDEDNFDGEEFTGHVSLNVAVDFFASDEDEAEDYIRKHLEKSANFKDCQIENITMVKKGCTP